MDAKREAAAETLALIEEERGEAAIHVGDVTQDKDCKATVREAVKRYGKLTTLVNNVGISGDHAPTEITQVSDADWDKVMDVNLKSAVLMTRHAVPEMAKAG